MKMNIRVINKIKSSILRFSIVVLSISIIVVLLFVALSPKLLHLTWVGIDEHEIGFKNTSLGQGANAALPMYALLLQKMNAEKSFRNITSASFPKPSGSVQEMLDCDPIKKDGFFKRLFKNPNKKKSKKFKNQ